MFAKRLQVRRRGSILPLVVLSLTALCGFVALAVDLGMMMVARTQCQTAADAAAMAGARTLDGSSTGNTTSATRKAQDAAEANTVLAQTLHDSEVTVTHGAYHYDSTAQTFSPQYPPTSPDNYNLTKVAISHSGATFFARVLNILSFQVGATAVAAHRPRDVSIVLDYSGSMNNESDLWNSESYLGSSNHSPNNTDTVVPSFGHYSSASASLVCTSSDPQVDKCNSTHTVLGVPAMVNDYYSNARGATSGTAAFTNVACTQLYLPPSGDQYRKVSGTSTTPPTFAQTVQDVTGASASQISARTDPIPLKQSPFSVSNGYDRTSWNGFTQGPGYWGKTFFIWPPYPEDPNNSTENSPHRDWRRRFFLKSGGSSPNFGGPVDDNTLLWDSSGNWRDPVDNNGTNYVINYAAILAWISSSPNPFPTTLRSGNILYYDSIPTDMPSSAYTYGNPNSQITGANQRFWKEYIDYVLGVWYDPYATTTTVKNSNRGSTHIQHPDSPSCSIGPDFQWGAVQISSPVSGYSDAPTTRLHPQDNPLRPRHRFWFGPLTMIQFLSDTGLLPGTAHDISMVAAKLGVDGALTDIQNNHPNDMVSMILFNRPHYNGEPAEAGAFTQAQFSLSRDYTGMTNALWFPPGTSSADCRPWDSNGIQTPRAHGDYTSNTATSYGFMLAYNQFSSSSSLRSAQLGGGGRKGAQRLLVLETDGMANVATSATFTPSGTNSYYNLGPSDTVTVDSSTTPGQACLNVVTRLVAQTTDTTNGPGFATPTKPVIVHCIAFGPVFETTASGGEAASAMSLLQQISTLGGTGFPNSVTDSTSPDFYKLCTGTLQQRQDKLRQAFSKIMDDGVAIILVQ